MVEDLIVYENRLGHVGRLAEFVDCLLQRRLEARQLEGGWIGIRAGKGSNFKVAVHGFVLD